MELYRRSSLDEQIQLFESNWHNAPNIFYHWVRRSIFKNNFAVSFSVCVTFHLCGESGRGRSRKGGDLDGYRIADAKARHMEGDLLELNSF